MKVFDMYTRKKVPIPKKIIPTMFHTQHPRQFHAPTPVKKCLLQEKVAQNTLRRRVYSFIILRPESNLGNGIVAWNVFHCAHV